MARKNVCNIIGHVAADAETRNAGGTPVVSWRVGVSAFKKDGETQWFSCSWWGDRAVKVAEYIRKGDAIDVTGEVSLRTYPKRDGSGDAVSLEIRVSDVCLLGGKRDAQPQRNDATRGSRDNDGLSSDANNGFDDVGSIPF